MINPLLVFDAKQLVTNLPGMGVPAPATFASAPKAPAVKIPKVKVPKQPKVKIPKAIKVPQTMAPKPKIVQPQPQVTPPLAPGQPTGTIKPQVLPPGQSLQPPAAPPTGPASQSSQTAPKIPKGFKVNPASGEYEKGGQWVNRTTGKVEPIPEYQPLGKIPKKIPYNGPKPSKNRAEQVGKVSGTQAYQSKGVPGYRSVPPNNKDSWNQAGLGGIPQSLKDEWEKNGYQVAMSNGVPQLYQYGKYSNALPKPGTPAFQEYQQLLQVGTISKPGGQYASLAGAPGEVVAGYR